MLNGFFIFQSPRFLLQYLVDLRELCALHSSNIKLCLACPDYGKNLPGTRLSDIFTFLGDAFPSPSKSDQNLFDHALNEVSVLISGLLEYYVLSQAVFKGEFFFIFSWFDSLLFMLYNNLLVMWQ